MIEYPKIQSIYKRNMSSPGRELLYGEWSLPEFEYLQSLAWCFTEKIDGTNVRVIWDRTSIIIKGRTERSQMPMRLLARLQERFGSKSLLGMALGDGPVCLYGEGFGAGIQKAGRMYGEDQDFILFDVRYGDMWLKRGDVVDIANKLGVMSVPIVGSGTLHYACQRVREGLSSHIGEGLAEGIVARPEVELFTRRGDRIITKIKSVDFGYK